jgi:hypothetical protein
MELTGDLPHRLFLAPVQAVNVVDLFRRKHRQILIYTGRTAPIRAERRRGDAALPIPLSLSLAVALGGL